MEAVRVWRTRWLLTNIPECRVGVGEVIPGKRRSLVNFHSFRRWFVTEAEQADQPHGIIAAVVGHKRKG